MSPDYRESLERELERLVGLWKKDPSVRSIFLFGPIAQEGSVAEDVEIDLVVVQETKEDFLTRIEPFYAEAKTRMDVLVYTPEEFAEMRNRTFLHHILEAGVPLYEAGNPNRRGRI